MIKVIIKKEWLNSKEKNKTEKCFKNQIEIVDEHGNHIPGIQSIQINLDVCKHPVLIMKTIDFELDGEFEGSEIMKDTNEDTTRI